MAEWIRERAPNPPSSQKIYSALDSRWHFLTAHLICVQLGFVPVHESTQNQKAPHPVDVASLNGELRRTVQEIHEEKLD
ncbi:hypothetical protein Y032_0121g986 [Ancylostoma ceylanicum]|uniref:SRCR domain-containing protein n=1 Tax=Ancylostoma ceylanicum TaxID=53326 RepID=A0A016TAD3_9BILA|nr:hypothetical protein Y032_0121g986 [Ancylostoma ceylanicum]